MSFIYSAIALILIWAVSSESLEVIESITFLMVSQIYFKQTRKDKFT